MARLMAREAALVLLSGLFTWYAVPLIVGRSPVPGLFLVGLVMGLTFMSLYAVTVLVGNKMPKRYRTVLGLLALAAAFGPDLFRQSPDPWLYGALVPGLILPGLGALTGGPEAAAGALYAYAFPVMGLRWLLLPLLQGSPMAASIALQTGAFYMGVRGLMRLYWPPSVEQEDSFAPPLVRRPVPDQVVGVLEGVAGGRARPYATSPGGILDPEAVSVLCDPAEAPALAGRIQRVLGDAPFAVSVGQPVQGEVEVVIRPRL